MPVGLGSGARRVARSDCPAGGALGRMYEFAFSVFASL